MKLKCELVTVVKHKEQVLTLCKNFVVATVAFYMPSNTVWLKYLWCLNQSLKFTASKLSLKAILNHWVRNLAAYYVVSKGVKSLQISSENWVNNNPPPPKSYIRSKNVMDTQKKCLIGDSISNKICRVNLFQRIHLNCLINNILGFL